VRPICSSPLAGGDLNLTAQWLGSGGYKPQGEGDLGTPDGAIALSLPLTVVTVILAPLD